MIAPGINPALAEFAGQEVPVSTVLTD